MVDSLQIPAAPLATPPAKVRRRWFQFNLKFLLALMLISALVVSAWQQWEQRQEFSQLLSQYRDIIDIRASENDMNNVFWAFDLTNPKHREALFLIKEIIFFVRGGYSIEQRNNESLPNDFKVWVFSDCVLTSTKDSTGTVAVLMRGKELVDVIFRDSSLDRETHRIFLPRTSDRDEIIVIFELHPGGAIDPHGKSLRYRATKTGFEKME